MVKRLKINWVLFFVFTEIIFSFVANSQQVVINECMPANSSTLHDAYGDTPDWIELYNKSSLPVNLNGFGITDKRTDTFKWVFPSFVLPPDRHLLLFASGKDLHNIPLHWSTVIDRGDIWKYLIPDSEPTSEWKTPAFNDSLWLSGKSGFGYGDNDDSTTIPNTISVFIRKQFEITDSANIRKAILHIDYDDGFVAYLNGYEIARAHLGTPGEAVTFNQEAGSHEAQIYQGGSPEAFIIDPVSGYLHNGINVLAIQVHNTDLSSSDMSAIPFLSLGMINAPDSAGEISQNLNIVQEGLHTNFKIDAAGETIFLFNSSGILLDSLYIYDMKPDISIGRKPDGAETVQFFISPTPGKENNNEGYLPFSGLKPDFSHPAGFYSSSLNLVLNAGEEDTIYFTIDGSDPDETSAVYAQPLNINDNTVVKARVIKNHQLPGEIITHTYIFRDDFDMPVISLSTNPANLWDADSGIYVLGNNAEPELPNNGANFWMDWERPAHIEFFEPNGRKGFDANVGIKIHGAYSRSNPQKSLAVYARKKYGQGKIDYDIFKYIPVNTFQSIVLRNSGGDFLNTTFRDAFHTSLVKDINIDLQAFRPAVIYINGEYWGIQNIREKINEHFIASHHQVSADSIDMLEFNASVIHGSEEHYNAMLAYINSHNMAAQSSYNYIKTQMDIDNFIDYQLSEIFIDNTDWPGNNLKYWRPQNSGGKWRWILFDTDFGFGPWNTNNYTNNTLAFALEPNNTEWPNPSWSTFLLRKLLENDEFKVNFINRFADNLNTLFKPNYVINYIGYLQDKYSHEMPLHLARWNGSADYWYDQVNNMKIFAENRAGYIRGFIRSQFGLSGLHNVSVNVNENGSGEIQLNSITPESYPWTGLYFNNIPVRLTAKPEPGFRFVRWEGSINSNEKVLSVNLLSDIAVTAIFEPDGSGMNNVIINEIYYNRMPESDAGDWVELYNRGNEAMNISYWRIKDSRDDHLFLIPGETILQPGEYFVVCEDSVLFMSQNGDITNFIGNMNFGFDKSGDCVRLYNYKEELVDSVCFKSSWPWPESSEGESHSIELINPFVNNNYYADWKTSLPGGTPGRSNDALTKVPEITGHKISILKQELSCYPNPFSDIATVEFGISQPDEVKIEVFDLNGELVKNLVSNHYDTGNYKIIWNMNEDRKQLPDGVYLIRMRTSDSVITKRVIRIGD